MIFEPVYHVQLRYCDGKCTPHWQDWMVFQTLKEAKDYVSSCRCMARILKVTQMISKPHGLDMPLDFEKPTIGYQAKTASRTHQPDIS